MGEFFEMQEDGLLSWDGEYIGPTTVNRTKRKKKKKKKIMDYSFIHCCACDAKVQARLTDGREVYPHRPDLFELPFWVHDACGNYVGCHHKTNDPTRPLGCIPTHEIRQARKRLHATLDPLWKSGKFKRKELYQEITDHLGWKFHTANIRSIEEAEKVLGFLGDKLK